MKKILNRPADGDLRRNGFGTRRAAMLSGAAALAAVITLTPLSFSSHGKLIALASAFAQSGSDTRQSTDDMSDDNGVDPVGHDAGDDKGVDAAGHDAGDDHGVDAAGHDAGDDHGGIGCRRRSNGP